MPVMEDGNELQPDHVLRTVALSPMFARQSDKLRQLPTIDTFEMDELFTVARVLPIEPTQEQYDHLAVDLSNLLEDVERMNSDAGVPPRPLTQISPPFGVLILDRVESVGCCPHDELFNAVVVKGRELMCVLYIVVPRWRGWDRDGMLARLDVLARVRGLRCLDHGKVPPVE